VNDEKGLRSLRRQLVRLKVALVAIERLDGLLDAGLPRAEPTDGPPRPGSGRRSSPCVVARPARACVHSTGSEPLAPLPARHRTHASTTGARPASGLMPCGARCWCWRTGSSAASGSELGYCEHVDVVALLAVWADRDPIPNGVDGDDLAASDATRSLIVSGLSGPDEGVGAAARGAGARQRRARARACRPRAECRGCAALAGGDRRGVLTAVLCPSTPGARVSLVTALDGSVGTTTRTALGVTCNDVGTEARLPTRLFLKCTSGRSAADARSRRVHRRRAWLLYPRPAGLGDRGAGRLFRGGRSALVAFDRADGGCRPHPRRELLGPSTKITRDRSRTCWPTWPLPRRPLGQLAAR